MRLWLQLLLLWLFVAAVAVWLLWLLAAYSLG